MYDSGSGSSLSDHSVETIVQKFESHPSTTSIKSKNLTKLSYKKITQKDVLEIIFELDIRKSCQCKDTPTKIMKKMLIFMHYTCTYISMSV